MWAALQEEWAQIEISVVLARLGPRALAPAWLEEAQAFTMPRPSQSPQ
jgi:hypothetical protein